MNFKQIKNAFKNYGTWTALLALIGFFGVAYIPGFDVGNWETFVGLLLALVVSLGIVSNPKEGEWFIDENNNGIDDREEDLEDK